ncbi:hypothetical protein TNCV_4050741, partial [Trichonephila clavipes]
EVEKSSLYQLNEEADRTERPIEEIKRHPGCFLPEVECIGKLEEKAAVLTENCGCQSSELLTASFHDFGDNFKLQEQLSEGFSSGNPRGTTHLQVTGTLSYRPEETGGRTAGEIARHTTQATTGRPISRFYRGHRRLHGGGLFARRPYGVYL